MQGHVERRYWLTGMPKGDFGQGMAIRYGYLDITDREYRLYEVNGCHFIGPIGDGLTETDIEISGDAYQLLVMATQNEYKQKIRFALQDEHQRYSVDEDTSPEGTYLGNPIREGEIQWADHGIEIRQKGETCFIARRLANRPVWEGGDVLISQEAFDFFWGRNDCMRIMKVRYEVRTPEDKNVGDTVWYVDRYILPSGGLVRAKVMLSGENNGVLPVPIAQVAFRAVTNDLRFRDWHLAKYGLVIELQEWNEFTKNAC
ncbi:MAG: hypothetical protein HGA33_06730 [Candidatus Moranbacteria bacterium]|nr:hypothetical protein [Candidatus Moranbacteria bacterium]